MSSFFVSLNTKSFSLITVAPEILQCNFPRRRSARNFSVARRQRAPTFFAALPCMSRQRAGGDVRVCEYFAHAQRAVNSLARPMSIQGPSRPMGWQLSF
jgi:hypothetical protein